MRTPLAWHLKARELRDEGMTHNDIATALGKERSCVGKALNPDRKPHPPRTEEQKIARKQRDRIYFGRNVSRTVEDNKSKILLGKSENSYIDIWVKRPPKVTLDRDAVMPAARAFARGDIGREEFMRMIAK